MCLKRLVQVKCSFGRILELFFGKETAGVLECIIFVPGALVARNVCLGGPSSVILTSHDVPDTPRPDHARSGSTLELF